MIEIKTCRFLFSVLFASVPFKCKYRTNTSLILTLNRRQVFNADQVINEKLQRMLWQVGAQRRALKWLMQKVEWQKILVHSLWQRVIHLQGVLAEIMGDDDEEEESDEITLEFDSGFSELDFH